MRIEVDQIWGIFMGIECASQWCREGGGGVKSFLVCVCGGLGFRPGVGGLYFFWPEFCWGGGGWGLGFRPGVFKI